MAEEKMSEVNVEQNTAMNAEQNAEEIKIGMYSSEDIHSSKSLVLDDGRIEAMKENLSPEELYQDLIKRVQKYHPSDDISMIEKAYHVASDAHKDQVRKSGEPYIIHPLCVSIILADLELDKETIVAGLLHDVVDRKSTRLNSSH